MRIFKQEFKQVGFRLKLKPELDSPSAMSGESIDALLSDFYGIESNESGDVVGENGADLPEAFDMNSPQFDTELFIQKILHEMSLKYTINGFRFVHKILHSPSRALYFVLICTGSWCPWTTR